MPTIAPERHPKRFTKRNWKGTGPKILEMQRRLKAKRERNVDIDIEDEDTVPEPFFLAPSTPTSDNPIGWPFAGYDPAQPFRFHDCPKHVRQLILHHAIYTKSFIRPRYNVGSVQTTPSATENLINFDTSLWLAVGNKRFYYAASAAFYGTSMFKFKDPALAFWWLKRIGSNLGKVRKLHLKLTDGNVQGSFDVPKERIWYTLLRWMRDRHQLSNIIIDTKAWDLMDISNKHPYGDPAIIAARHHSLRLLLRFRGPEAATVVPGEWVNENDAEVLAKAMMIKEGRSTREVQDYDEELEGDLASMLEGPLVPKGRYLMG